MNPTSNTLTHTLTPNPNRTALDCGGSTPLSIPPADHGRLTTDAPATSQIKNPAPDSNSLFPSLPPVESSALRVPSSALVRAQLSVETTVDASDSDILHIRASDETLDRYKEVIVASGWRLENYLRNPVIQNAHQYGDIIFTIGRAEKTWVSGNALLQTWRFASNENPFAKIARDLYRGKFLQAASVGFIPLKWEDGDPNPTLNHTPGRASVPASQFRRRYLEQELIEVSAVGIPANPNALTLALRAGAVQESDLRELFQLLKHLVSARNADCQSAVPQAGSLHSAPDEIQNPKSQIQNPISSHSSHQSDSVTSVPSVNSVLNLLPELRSLLLSIQNPKSKIQN